MHAPRRDDSLTRTHAAPGEPFVWLTAMGLAAGLLMVAGLLFIIVANGLPVFWPSKVYRVELREGAVNPVPGGGDTFVGQLVQTRNRRTPVLDDGGRRASDQREYQFFVGNKDAYGVNFVYVDAASVKGMTQPQEIMRFERMEYGIAFGVPIQLTLEGGGKIAGTDPTFTSALSAAVRQASLRRAEIEQIERVQIGRVNSRINRLKSRGEGAGAIAALEEEFQQLAAKARALREQQGAVVLTYQTPNGMDRSLACGELLSFYKPNALTFTQRVGIFLSNIWNFLTLQPREANTEGGIFPAIFGTFVMTLLMSVAVMPFGVVAAIYLREYAKQGFLVRAVRIAVNNLAGVPSIVFGVFGLGFFVYFVGSTVDRTFFPEFLPTPTFGTGGILWASLTLALMTVPVVIVATEEAVAAVPRGMKEGSLACGASKWQTVQRIVLPASLPGILTGLILAMARGAGEVAPLMLVGVVKLAPSLPIDGDFPFLHLERKFMHLGFHIYDLGFQSPDAEAAKPMVFATTLLLIVLVVVLNLTAILLREHLRKRYSTGAF
jgi:phosphate transport system permease protein